MIPLTHTAYIEKGWFLAVVFLNWAFSISIVNMANGNLSSFTPEMLDEALLRLPVLPQEHTADTLLDRSNSTKKVPPVSIFFHIFVPNEKDIARPDHTQRATKIIGQQLRHVREALATVPNMEPAALYYTTVGRPLEDGFMEEICNKHSMYFHCHHLKHVDEGFEEHTLGALYDHCHEHDHDRVIYIHTKGSYHNSKSQSRWRRHMTDAVASRDCIERAHEEDCDLCGLLFLPRPSLHFTGNMFNAKCSYIQKLPHPMEFQDKMAAFDAKAHGLIEKGTLQSNLLDLEQPWNAGVERFSMEHWHGSHPSVQQICDVSNHPNIQYWQDIRAVDRKPDDWQFAVFPRHSNTAKWSHGSSDILVANIMNDESRRKREYFLLPGQLMKWYDLYGEAPPPSSWVWSWYPDGEFWKQQVQKHGSKAVEMVSRQWVQDTASTGHTASSL